MALEFPVLLKWTKKLAETVKTKHTPDVLRFIIDTLEAPDGEWQKGNMEFDTMIATLRSMAPEVARSVINEITKTATKEAVSRLSELEKQLRKAQKRAERETRRNRPAK